MDVKTIVCAMFLFGCTSYEISSYRFNIEEETVKRMKFGETKEFSILYRTDEKSEYGNMDASVASKIRKEFDKSLQENFASKINANSEDVIDLKLNVKTEDIKEKKVECRQQADSVHEHMLGKFVDFLYGDNVCYEDNTYYDVVATGTNDNRPIFETRIKHKGQLVATEEERLKELKNIFNKMTKYFGKIKLGQV